jgi:hypothetical protein
MAKNYRGREVANMPNHGRGECPVCHRTGIKVLYEIKLTDKTIKVCKICKGISPEKINA